MNKSGWSDTGKHPRFLIFDWRLAIFGFPILFNLFSWWPYVLFIVCGLYFNLLNYKGVTLPNYFKRIHYAIIGKRAYGKPKWERNRR